MNDDYDDIDFQSSPYDEDSYGSSGALDTIGDFIDDRIEDYYYSKHKGEEDGSDGGEDNKDDQGNKDNPEGQDDQNNQEGQAGQENKDSQTGENNQVGQSNQAGQNNPNDLNGFDNQNNFNGFNNQNNEDRQKDINSINDRRKANELGNENRHANELGNEKRNANELGNEKRKTDDLEGNKDKKEKKDGESSDKKDDGSASSNKDGASSDKKDGKDGNDGKDNKKDKKDKKAEKAEKAKEKAAKKAAEKAAEEGAKKGILALKIKIILIAAAVVICAFLLIFLILFIITAIDHLTLGLTTSYGVPEMSGDETGNLPGLFSDEQYMYDENGNPMGSEELINYLENNSNCEGNIWTNISDKLGSLFGHEIKDACELIRYVKTKTKENNVDEALIITTIFYTFDSRPSVESYYNPEDAPDGISTTQHFQGLMQVLQDENTHLTRAGIDKLIEYAHASGNSYYYEWVIEENKDSSGNVTGITGKCVYKESGSEAYNLDKWKVFMRFGEEAASKYDNVVLKSKNHETSSDECKDSVNFTKEKLEEQLRLSAELYGSGVSYTLDFDSVKNARNDLNGVDSTTSDIFYQAADIYSSTKDTFRSYDGITFDYKNGYVYQNFPSYKASMEEGGEYYGKVNIHYDDIFTPKEIEQVIINIIEKKTNLNGALLREDPDTPEDYESSLDGYTGVPTGANCMPYLPASLNKIKVRLTDCLGNYLDTVSFEDYIIGVANGEVSNRNDDYVLSQMVAAISYALNRHNNYAKGSTIEMRSGTCDQVYCSMLRGCHGKNTPVGACNICNSYYIGGGKKSPDLYPKYQALYEIASDYLLVKNDKPFSAHYVSSIQNGWYEKSSHGMAFTQIMQEEYGDEGATLIRCSDTGSEADAPNLPGTSSDKVGNVATEEYPNVSPDLGVFYGFSYKDGTDSTSITINPEWKEGNLVTISPKCNTNVDFSNKQFVVHKSAANNFETAFKNVCKLLKDNFKVNGEKCNYTVDDILDGTVFIERKSSSGSFDTHAYGISQDINYSKKITVNGRDYTPYNTRDLSEYLEFVEAIGGDEENCKNINYILWKYAYKSAGFNWGGNYGRNGFSGTYDGKLFELKYD